MAERQIVAMGGGGFSMEPDNDGEPGRRPAFHRLVADGALAGGWAADDGAAIHFVRTEVREVVASRAGAAAYRVDRRRGRAAQRRLEARLLV